MVIFHSFLYVYQRGTIIGYLENPLWIFMAGKIIELADFPWF
jgi:hypothetical protein